MMTRYFEKRTVYKQITKPIKRYLLSFVCCLVVALGSLLVPSYAQTFRVGDEVVLQNTFNGLEVLQIPKVQPDIVPDGTRGIIVDGPITIQAGFWYKVRWKTSPEVRGWGPEAEDGCRIFGTIEEAEQRDKITAKLFGMSLTKNNTGSHQVDRETNHEYNGYGCNVNWKENGEFVYDGGHAGWDAQTISTFDPDRNARFYSLTAGKVIRADKGTSKTSSVIAVYSEADNKATLYLHAREEYVTVGQDVKVGYLLGSQGNTGLESGNDTDGSHVHIEVRTLTEEQMELSSVEQEEWFRKSSAGTDDKDRPTIDPIPYLYASVKAAEEETNGRGGDGGQSNPDVNDDNRVNIRDLLFVWVNIGENVKDFPKADVNQDGIIDKEDIVEVAKNLDDPGGAAAPVNSIHNQISGITIRAGQIYIGDKIIPQKTVQQLLNIVREADSGSLTFKRGIAMLESILAAMAPNKTVLLANYPNPFNPETWIPYQLAESADVTLTIYDLQGKLIRRLALGHQPVGIYQDRNRAAHWDGKNELGEPVASGLYFYTLTAGDFSATRKMLIRK